MAKKIFGLLIIIFVLTSLFGCQPATQQAAEQATQAPVAQATNTTAAKPAEATATSVATPVPQATEPPAVAYDPAKAPTLDYYIMGTDPTERADVEKAINDYVGPLIGAKVTFHFIGWNDWATKTVTGMEAGDKMDIVFVADWYYYMQFATEGLLTPLNDDKGPNGNLLKQYGQGILSTLNPAFITGSQIDGVSYAVPTNKELSVPWGFVYNVAVADKIGFTDEEAAKIKSMKDMEPWLEKAKTAFPDFAPYLTDGTIGFMPWVHGFTSFSDYVVNMSAIPDASGKVDETIMNPMATDWMKSYLQTMRSWYQKGYVPKDAGLSTFDTSKLMNAGQFFIEPMPLKGNNIKAQELVIASGNPDLKLKEIYGMPKVINTSDAGGSMLAIPKSSEHPVEAMKLINLMHTDAKLINMMLYGVPDKMWKTDPDGRVNIVDDNWLKAHPGAWVWADITIQKVTNKEDPKKNQLLIDYAKDAFPEPSLGFRFRDEPVAAEKTAIQAVVDGSQRALLTGYVDPVTELPKFLQALKDAGLDKVIAEVQKQYTEWKAKSGK